MSGALKLKGHGEQPAAAHLASAPTQSTPLTAEGMIVGTLQYMAPEQLDGKAADARIDLFSLGVVLYEMTTGTAPFRGATSGAVLSEILTKALTAPVRLNPDVPPELERIVNKLLEKDRRLRYQSARDVHVDLERLRRALTAFEPTRPEQASIVVLPFEDISAGRDNEYFADGLTEEIIADLSRVRALRVISRTSAMRLKGTDKDLLTVASELNVRYVLEGSVRKAGNNLRITAQLVDASMDTHLWAEKYTGTLDDVFEIQEKVSRGIVEALKLKLTRAEDRRVAKRSIDNAQAHELYLRARQEVSRLTADSFERALNRARFTLVHLKGTSVS